MANSYLPASYQQNWGYGNPQPMYQSYAQPMSQGQYSGMQQSGQGTQGIKWVDGEAEAKGTPIPSGVSQFAMWDINEPVIYIKTLNQMGMPNPMQKAHYKLEQKEQSGNMNSGMSRQEEKEDKSEYVTKADFENMKNELKELLNQSNTSSKRGQRNESV